MAKTTKKSVMPTAVIATAVAAATLLTGAGSAFAVQPDLGGGRSGSSVSEQSEDPECHDDSGNGELNVLFKDPTRAGGLVTDEQVDQVVLQGSIGHSCTIEAPAHYKFHDGSSSQTVTLPAIPASLPDHVPGMPEEKTFQVDPIPSTFNSVIRYVYQNDSGAHHAGESAYWYTPSVDVQLNGEYITNLDEVNSVINENMPKGFQNAGGNLDNTVPFRFGDIIVRVNPNSSSTPAPSNQGEEVVYFKLADGQQVGLKTLTGHVGDVVNVSAPAGYEFVTAPSPIPLPELVNQSPAETTLTVRPISLRVPGTIQYHYADDVKNSSGTVIHAAGEVAGTADINIQLDGNKITNISAINSAISENRPVNTTIVSGYLANNSTFYDKNLIVAVKPVSPSEPSSPSTPSQPSTPSKPSKPTVAYKDVHKSDWFDPAVYKAADEGLMTGYNKYTFGPYNPVTREEAAVILYRRAGKPDVSDKKLTYKDSNKVSFWAHDAVIWAGEKHIMNGYGTSNVFGPQDSLTREQAAAILARDNGKVADTSLAGAMQWAIKNKVINGWPDARGYQPKGIVDRAQMAQILVNAVKQNLI